MRDLAFPNPVISFSNLLLPGQKGQGASAIWTIMRTSSLALVGWWFSTQDGSERSLTWLVAYEVDGPRLSMFWFFLTFPIQTADDNLQLIWVKFIKLGVLPETKAAKTVHFPFLWQSGACKAQIFPWVVFRNLSAWWNIIVVCSIPGISRLLCYAATHARCKVAKHWQHYRLVVADMPPNSS